MVISGVWLGGWFMSWVLFGNNWSPLELLHTWRIPVCYLEGSMPVNEADDFFLLNGGRAWNMPELPTMNLHLFEWPALVWRIPTAPIIFHQVRHETHLLYSIIKPVRSQINSCRLDYNVHMKNQFPARFRTLIGNLREIFRIYSSEKIICGNWISRGWNSLIYPSISMSW